MSLRQAHPDPYTTAEERIGSFYSLRCLERSLLFVLFFGLIVPDPNPVPLFARMARLRKSPLQDQAVTFRV